MRSERRFLRFIRVALVVFLGCAGVSLTGCELSFEDNTPLCVPGEYEEGCICRQGAEGHQICADDGLGYGACICGPAPRVDAGPGADAAPDTPDAGTSPDASLPPPDATATPEDAAASNLDA